MATHLEVVLGTIKFSKWAVEHFESDHKLKGSIYSSSKYLIFAKSNGFPIPCSICNYIICTIVHTYVKGNHNSLQQSDLLECVHFFSEEVIFHIAAGASSRIIEGNIVKYKTFSDVLMLNSTITEHVQGCQSYKIYISKVTR